MLLHSLMPRSSPTFPLWQFDQVPETRAAQGDGEQPTRVVSTMMVEDVSPIKYRKLRWGRQHVLLPSSQWPQGDQKGYSWGLCYRHPHREEGQAAWKSLGRQRPPRTPLGDGSCQCPLCYPQLSRRPPQSTAGGFAPGRCIPEPLWAAPRCGSRRGAPRGPRSMAECGEPAPHRGTPSAPPSPAGPPFPASSWGKHRDEHYPWHKRDGVAKTPRNSLTHTQSLFSCPFCLHCGQHQHTHTHRASALTPVLVSPSEQRQGLLSSPTTPFIHATPSFLT